MKAVFQKLTTRSAEGFTFRDIRSSGFDCPWHVHSEYELILVLKGSGHRVVATYFGLEGRGPGNDRPDLPHIWLAEPVPAGRPSVHFLLIAIRGKLSRGRPDKIAGDGTDSAIAGPVQARPLHITGRTRDRVRFLMEQMGSSRGVNRIVQFLQVSP